MTLLISPPAEVIQFPTTPPSVIEIINAIAGRPGEDGEDADPTLYYTKEEIDAMLLALGIPVHDHDYTYYTKVEVDHDMDVLADMIAARSVIGHTHEDYVVKVAGKSLIDDAEMLRLSTVYNADLTGYYTKAEVDLIIGDIEAVLDTILGGA
jgi:hypothetical protein